MNEQELTVFRGSSFKDGNGEYKPSAKLDEETYTSLRKLYNGLFRTPLQSDHKNNDYIITAKEVRVTPGDPKEKGWYQKEDHFHRNDRSVISTQFIPIDGDATTEEADSCIDPKLVYEFMKGTQYQFIIWTTHSHSKTRNRWRLIVPCVCGSREEYQATCLKLGQLLQMKFPNLVLATENPTLSQAWYIAAREDPDDGLHFSRCKATGISFPVATSEEIKQAHTEVSKPSGKLTIEDMKQNIKSGDYVHHELRDLLYQYAKDKHKKGISDKDIIRRGIKRGKRLLNTSARKDPKYEPHKDHLTWLQEWGELEVNVAGGLKLAKSEIVEVAPKKPLRKIRRKSKNQMPVIPDELIFPDDDYGKFLKNVMDSTQHRNNPVAAMVHGRSVIAFACDNYATVGGSTTSGFDILLGDSQKGKTLTAKAARRFLPSASLGRMITKFKTGEGLEERFINNIERPSIFASIDEIGMNLNASKNSSSGNNELTGRLLEIATNGTDAIPTRPIASQPMYILNAPRLVTCGNTTIAALKGAIKRKEVETGQTNRQRFFNASQDVTNKREREAASRITEFEERIARIIKYCEISSEKRCNEYLLVKITNEVDDWIFKHDEKMLASDKDNSIRGRHTELALSWAIPRAVWANHKEPAIDLDLFMWAYEIVDYSLKTIEHLYTVYLGDENDTVEAERKLTLRLEENKGEMNKRRALNFRPYKEWDSQKKNNFLYQLDRAGAIEEGERETRAGRIEVVLRLIG